MERHLKALLFLPVLKRKANMEFSKMTNNFSHMMKKSTILRGLLALLIWIPVLMVVWFWSIFILAFLMRG